MQRGRVGTTGDDRRVSHGTGAGTKRLGLQLDLSCALARVLAEQRHDGREGSARGALGDTHALEFELVLGPPDPIECSA
jgi:hypothetical protein